MASVESAFDALLAALREANRMTGNQPLIATLFGHALIATEDASHHGEARQVLRARLQWQGTRLGFGNEADDAWWWLMAGADRNAARLLLLVLDDPEWRDDLGRLVAGLLARQRRGVWDTTTANLWGVLALERFSARHESAAVTGSSRATIETGTAPPVAAAASADWRDAAAPRPVLLPWPAGGGAGTLTVAHAGGGRPWATVQALAAVPLAASVAAGYSLSRELRVIERADPSQPEGTYGRGDVLRVTLQVQAAADMNWVVLSDPIPGGATILGSGLGRDSGIATQGERRAGTPPVHEERSFEAWRVYWDHLPKGTHKVEYTLRLNNAGDFALPPTRIEAMYAPEAHGALPNARVRVAPGR